MERKRTEREERDGRGRERKGREANVRRQKKNRRDIAETNHHRTCSTSFRSSSRGTGKSGLKGIGEGPTTSHPPSAGSKVREADALANAQGIFVEALRPEKRQKKEDRKESGARARKERGAVTSSTGLREEMRHESFVSGRFSFFFHLFPDSDRLTYSQTCMSELDADARGRCI